MLMNYEALQKIAQDVGRSPRGLFVWNIVARYVVAAGGLDLVARLSFLEGVFGVRPNTWAARGGGKALREILKSEGVARRGLDEQQVRDLLTPWTAPGDTGIVSNIRLAITPILKGVGIEPDDLIMPALAGLAMTGEKKRKPVFYAAGAGSFFDLDKFLDGKITVSQVASAATGYMKRRALDAKTKELFKLKQQERIDRGTPSDPGTTRDVPSFTDLSESEKTDLIAIALADLKNPAFRDVKKEVAKLISRVSSQSERKIFWVFLRESGKGKSNAQIGKEMGISAARVSVAKRELGKKVRKEFEKHPEILEPIFRSIDIERLGLGRARFAEKLKVNVLVQAYQARTAA